MLCSALFAGKGLQMCQIFLILICQQKVKKWITNVFFAGSNLLLPGKINTVCKRSAAHGQMHILLIGTKIHRIRKHLLASLRLTEKFIVHLTTIKTLVKCVKKLQIPSDLPHSNAHHPIDPEENQIYHFLYHS